MVLAVGIVFERRMRYAFWGGVGDDGWLNGV
jgi:hypothetical protein